MKRILINKKNQAAIEDAIKLVEGQCRKRTISYEDVAHAVSVATQHLNLLVDKEHQIGTVIEYQPVIELHDGYRGRIDATYCRMIYHSSGWHLSAVYRACAALEQKALVVMWVTGLPDELKRPSVLVVSTEPERASLTTRPNRP